MAVSRKRRCKYGKLKQKTKGRVCKKRFSRRKSKSKRRSKKSKRSRKCKHGKLKNPSGRRRCKKRRTRRHRMGGKHKSLGMNMM